MVYVAGVILATLLLTPVLVAIIQRKEPLMNEQDTDGTTPPHDTTADNVEDVLRKRTGGTEEHPVEGHADEAQREPQAGLGNDTPPDRQENATSDHTTTA